MEEKMFKMFNQPEPDIPFPWNPDPNDEED